MRATPHQPQMILHLELLSVLLLARLLTKVTESLSQNMSLEQLVCYTDSQVALCWIIRQEGEWEQFVENRVREKCELALSTCLRHCPGLDNPADLPSRGLSPLELSTSKMALWTGLAVQLTRRHCICDQGSFSRLLKS